MVFCELVIMPESLCIITILGRKLVVMFCYFASVMAPLFSGMVPGSFLLLCLVGMRGFVDFIL